MQRVGKRLDGTRGWVVGRVADAPVVVSPGWLLLAVVVVLLAGPYLERFSPGLGALSYVVAAVGAVLLFVSVFLHEVGHAVVARRRGLAVREVAVTLLGGHTRFAASAASPSTSALVAVSGPVVNLVLAGVAFAVLGLLPPGGVPHLLVGAAAVANLLVALFNLIPALPMDGGRLLEAAVWGTTGRRWPGTLAAAWGGRVVAVGVVVWGLLPTFTGGSSDLGRVGWAALTGAFLWSGAGASLRAARAERAATGLSVRGLMQPAIAVPPDSSLADADALAGRGAVVVVGRDGRPLGYLDTVAAAQVPPEHRRATPVTAVTRGLPPEAALDVGLVGPAALQAVARLAQTTPVMAVLGQGGDVVGLLRAQDVITAIRGGT